MNPGGSTSERLLTRAEMKENIVPYTYCIERFYCGQICLDLTVML